ncbi:metalloregulator ArsR/SmtB family transcription factor [Nocardia cyriacigeorgica]|uniref:Metalloregulator ArsR/SmtB family transcription factor n=1 Tax=Nocardia cyriacigeorgica TaxID=135487 RepID=A0A5R8PFG2_9NOCA|nr:metalloregulator ArsR/SmtB family transcription factor [Nocardia cyriacigeorgica]TLG13424.1 metalloregulator ArsR/SmtB family transcription factor [Nocardia cyriacigeorgica]
MNDVAAALGDASRWRLIELLAERPRSVGELAELSGLRQPQATKHLQTLARTGLVTVFPLGQRRVYAIETDTLRALELRLRHLIELSAGHGGERDVIERYRAAIEAETALAQQDRWADGRTFGFERLLAETPDVVWRYWTQPDLLASWWAPPSMTITDCALEPAPGGRAVLDYRDADGHRYRSAGRVHAATEPVRLAFDLSVLDDTEAITFTGHYDLTLEQTADGTRLRLGLRITDTAVDAVAFIAGIESGWNQVLDELAATVAAATPTSPTSTESAQP